VNKSVSSNKSENQRKSRSHNKSVKKHKYRSKSSSCDSDEFTPGSRDRHISRSESRSSISSTHDSSSDKSVYKPNSSSHEISSQVKSKSESGTERRRCRDPECLPAQKKPCGRCKQCKRRHRCIERVCDHVKPKLSEVTCPKCFKMFKESLNLKRHLKLPSCRPKRKFPRAPPQQGNRIPLLEILFTCQVHDYATRLKKKELDLHLANRGHEDDLTEILLVEYQCTGCDYRSENRRSVRTHNATHHKERMWTMKKTAAAEQKVGTTADREVGTAATAEREVGTATAGQKVGTATAAEWEVGTAATASGRLELPPPSRRLELPPPSGRL